MDVCVKRTDGSIWCSNGYFNINNSLANKIEESKLPYKSSYLLYTSGNVSKLSKVNFSLRKEPAKYMEKDIIVKDEVISDACISYNKSTKELKKSDSWNAFFDFDNDKKEDYLSQNKNAIELIKFCLDVYSQNEYVYDLLTSLVPTLRGGFVNSVGESMYTFCIYAVNLYNNIENIGSFEKTAKAMGKKFIYKNIGKKDFSLNNAKKLNNVMDIPIEAANLMKRLKLENYYNDFKRLSQINSNYVVTFLNAVNDFKRVINISKMVGTNNLNNQVGDILRSLIKLMESGYYDFKVLLNYLFREFFYFNDSNVGLPCDEARNLIDYINLATNMGGKSSLKFDKMPRNLKRAHAVLSTNNMILSNPRPQEFIDAVSCYSDFVSWVPSDTTTPYIFKAPENELELLNEGNILHHCVASYRDLIIDNGCIVVFMRKRDDPDTPFVTIEYLNGKTVQVKEKYNEDVEDKKVLEVIGKWLAVTRRKEIAKFSGK